jgi:hypothetical protein
MKTARPIIKSYCWDILTEKKNNLVLIKMIMMYQHIELVMILCEISDDFSIGMIENKKNRKEFVYFSISILVVDN